MHPALIWLFALGLHHLFSNHSFPLLSTLLWARIAARFANRSTPMVLNRATGAVLVVLGTVILGVNWLV